MAIIRFSWSDTLHIPCFESHCSVSLSSYAGHLKVVPGKRMSDVEPDDDAEVGAPAVVVNGQDVNL